ncbi:hypothetical protein FQR65_LT01570 [Abscondita terminalis]|nr:hypothetical protein FQR65_LT01570 [Abscondita terminalis]
MYTKLVHFSKNFLQRVKHSCRALSYVHNPGKEGLLPLTLGKLLENAATQYGEKTAIISVYDNRRFSFNDVFNESQKLAAALHSLGLQKGDRVGLWMPNIIEFVTTLFAASQGGFIAVSLNPLYIERDLQYCIEKVGIKALICLENYRNIHFYDTLTNLLPELKNSKLGKLNSKRAPCLKSVITISNNSLR